MTKASILSLLFFLLLCPGIGFTASSDPFLGVSPVEMEKSIKSQPPPQAPAVPAPAPTQTMPEGGKSDRIERGGINNPPPESQNAPTGVFQKNQPQGVAQEIEKNPREVIEEPPAGSSKTQPIPANVAPNSANVPKEPSTQSKDNQKPIDTYIRGY